MDSSTSSKAYWSLLKMFLINKKIPCFPPLFHNSSFIRDKAELFNALQCTLIDNASEIPATFNIKTTKMLSSIPVTRAYIAKIKILDPNKAHGHYMIILRMLKLCGDTVLPPLDFICKSCLESCAFLSEWKKSKCSSSAQKG